MTPTRVPGVQSTRRSEGTSSARVEAASSKQQPTSGAVFRDKSFALSKHGLMGLDNVTAGVKKVCRFPLRLASFRFLTKMWCSDGPSATQMSGNPVLPRMPLNKESPKSHQSPRRSLLIAGLSGERGCRLGEWTCLQMEGMLACAESFLGGVPPSEWKTLQRLWRSDAANCRSCYGLKR